MAGTFWSLGHGDGMCSVGAHPAHRLLKVTTHTMVFECLRGKQRGRRAGFQWSCPRSAASLDADFGDAFIRAIAQQPLEFASIAFHAETGQELSSAVCRTKVHNVLAGVLHPEDIALLSGKSWRQVGVTWGFLAKLDATQVCALGNWLDTSEFKGNKMPWRYFRAGLGFFSTRVVFFSAHALQLVFV